MTSSQSDELNWLSVRGEVRMRLANTKLYGDPFKGSYSYGQSVFHLSVRSTVR